MDLRETEVKPYVVSQVTFPCHWLSRCCGMIMLYSCFHLRLQNTRLSHQGVDELGVELPGRSILAVVMMNFTDMGPKPASAL